jgi:hypothetical protein
MTVNDLIKYLASRNSFGISKHPFVYSEIVFDKKHAIKDIFEAISDPFQVVEWNKTVKYIQLVDKF